MCEYCKGKNILTIDGYLAIYINNQNKLKAITTNREFGEDINYCPMCRKEARRVNKEEIVQRLKFVADEIDKDIKIFEETHNFEHIYDYNVYSIKEFIDEFINIMNTMKEDKQ